MCVSESTPQEEMTEERDGWEREGVGDRISNEESERERGWSCLFLVLLIPRQPCSAPCPALPGVPCPVPCPVPLLLSFRGRASFSRSKPAQSLPRNAHACNATCVPFCRKQVCPKSNKRSKLYKAALSVLPVSGLCYLFILRASEDRTVHAMNAQVGWKGDKFRGQTGLGSGLGCRPLCMFCCSSCCLLGRGGAVG